MADLCIVDFGGGDDARAEREAERARFRRRYVAHVVAAVGVDELTADRVVAAIFDHPDADGTLCGCGCQVAVEAERTTSFAPEQREGTVDGHSFYFRERHGTWRIELDLDHLWAQSCDHAGALLYCPKCGARMAQPS